MSFFNRAIAQTLCLILIFGNAAKGTGTGIFTGQPTSKFLETMAGYADNQVPDLNDLNHLQSFIFYIRTHFQGDTDAASYETMVKLREILATNRPAAKDRFGVVEIEFENFAYRTPEELIGFSRSLIDTQAQMQSIFIQPLANIGEWKKMKHQGVLIFESDSNLQKLLEILNVEENPLKVPTDEREMRHLLKRYQVALASISISENVKQELLAFLISYIAFLQNKSFSLSIRELLKSQDPHSIIKGIRTYSNNRHDLAIEIFGKNYPEELFSNDYARVIRRPLFSNERLLTSTRHFEDAVNKSKHNTGEERGLVRPLSTFESPFRSCLATDCATRTYFERALDEGYYYFTYTDADGKSTGHVTIVLGTARNKEEVVRVAMVDKVQGIDHSKLELVLESIRRSVEAQGYQLSLLTRLGPINFGTSNSEETIDALASLASYKNQGLKYTNFEPESKHSTFLNNEVFSRSDKNLSLVPLLPMDTPKKVHMSLRAPVPQKMLSNKQSFFRLIEDSFQLKNGDLRQKENYLSITNSLFQNKQPIDPDFSETVHGWIENRSLPKSFRLKALTAVLQIIPESFYATHRESIWSFFSAAEISQIMSHWAQDKFFSTETIEIAALTALPFVRTKDQIVFKKAFPHFENTEVLNTLSEISMKDIFKKLLTFQESKLDQLEEKKLQLQLAKLLIYFEGYLISAKRKSNKASQELKKVINENLIEILGFISSKRDLELKARLSNKLAMALSDESTLLDEKLLVEFIHGEIDKINLSLKFAKGREKLYSKMTFFTAASFGLFFSLPFGESLPVEYRFRINGILYLALGVASMTSFILTLVKPQYDVRDKIDKLQKRLNILGRVDSAIFRASPSGPAKCDALLQGSTN